MSDAFDLIVIGAGPGGYVAAIRAAQLGMKVACIELEPVLGGTCLRVGCIPSKALLDSSHRWAEVGSALGAHGIAVEGARFDLSTMLGRKDKIVGQLTDGIAHLFRKNHVERIVGRGRLAGDNKVEIVEQDGAIKAVLSAKNILVATGSTPAMLPGIECDPPGASPARVGTSTDALAYPEVPGQLIVIGAGVIGLELGSVWARLGSKVTVLEFQSGLLPLMDPDLVRVAERAFSRQGLEFRFGAKVRSARAVAGGRCRVGYDDPKAGPTVLDSDRVLVAVGRRPNIAGLGADRIGLTLDSRGAIAVDAHGRTNVPGVWAIGDVVAGPMLAHKAEEEGIAVVETMAGLQGHVCYDAIASIIYTHPEIAAIGKTEADCVAAGIPYKSARFPFAANGRAKALGDTEGFVKLVAHEQTDRLLGAHLIGPCVSELAAEIALAIEFSASAEDIARSVHAHPTLSEAVKEAALGIAGRTIHA